MENLLKLEFTSIWWAIILPLILMVLDIITGYYNAWKNNEVSSTKMRDGLGKKFAELCYIAVGFMFNFAFNTNAIMYFMVVYVIYMELISLAENCDKLGVKLPDKLQEKLNNNIETQIDADDISAENEGVDEDENQ